MGNTNSNVTRNSFHYDDSYRFALNLNENYQATMKINQKAGSTVELGDINFNGNKNSEFNISATASVKVQSLQACTQMLEKVFNSKLTSDEKIDCINGLMNNAEQKGGTIHEMNESILENDTVYSKDTAYEVAQNINNTIEMVANSASEANIRVGDLNLNANEDVTFNLNLEAITEAYTEQVSEIYNKTEAAQESQKFLESKTDTQIDQSTSQTGAVGVAGETVSNVVSSFFNSTSMIVIIIIIAVLLFIVLFGKTILGLFIPIESGRDDEG